MPRVVVIDNYDSFTYNLAHDLLRLGAEVQVFRNDAVTVADIWQLNPSHLVLSPGPGRPSDAGVSAEAVRTLGGHVPVLGVCLGHQVIGEGFGGRIISAPTLMHGKTSAIFHDGMGLFNGLPSPFSATRYHSLVVDPDAIPAELLVTAHTADGVVMALQHRSLPLYGVQFHPESVLTEGGITILDNFLKTGIVS
ncbi:MAG: aminodeoxychorismate/anthranilate synthase component II [Candidatus Margulisiibacteriota bacterium]